MTLFETLDLAIPDSPPRFVSKVLKAFEDGILSLAIEKVLTNTFLNDFTFIITVMNANVLRLQIGQVAMAAAH